MSVDQEARPFLKGLGDYAALMSEFGVIMLNQKRVEHGHYQYFASRTDRRLTSMPKAVSVGDIEVRLYLALRSVHNRASNVSAKRAIRHELSCSEDESEKILLKLITQSLIKDGRPPHITEQGKVALL